MLAFAETADQPKSRTPHATIFVLNKKESNMKRNQGTPRRDKWDKIEGRVFGQCMWQHMSESRRCMLEGLIHRATGRVMIVEKTYMDPIPHGTERPWPELGGVNVYDQVAPEITKWDEFETALGRV